MKMKLANLRAKKSERFTNGTVTAILTSFSQCPCLFSVWNDDLMYDFLARFP